MPRLSLKSRQVFAIGVLLGGWIGFGLARLATGESDDLVLRIEPIATPAVAVVYVRGAVARPGLYTLPADARVAHAVERAGPRSDADLARVSMAERVRDGQTIDVPAVGQPAEDTPTAVGLGATDVGASPEEGSRKIDVNRASAAELERLPGVG
ncbi:MAG: SLBB domain-containing protein, partial [Thermomicrobium sp.]|nr:SLBB domain-containing protein [Thermomicrobium sp.]